MHRIVLLLLILALPLGPAWAEDRPRIGLLWNRSGLPATLPLQVQTAPGPDHVIFLTRPGARTPEVAGYIHGGEFFRLLVPPGSWQIGLASGRDWQGEAALFGAATAWTELPEPLRFAAGAARLNGHVLTVMEDADAGLSVDSAPRIICRMPHWTHDLFDRPDRGDRLTLDNPRQLNPARPDRPPEKRLVEPLDDEPGQLRLRSVLCD